MNKDRLTPFLDDSFLLSNRIAEELYHDTAKDLPILDYHNHLSPKAIAEDKNFKDLTEIWLDGDHYKWRAMRANGIEEQYITGDASPEEKFRKWAETVPYTLRNPLYHWTHMELKVPFQIHDLLNPQNADSIFETCTQLLQQPAFSTVSLLKNWKVEALCTTDDPVDNLNFHQQIAANPAVEFRVRPSFRPDQFLGAHDTKSLNAYYNKIEALTGSNIENFDALKEAISKRHDFFDQQGCKLFDIALNQMPVSGYTGTDIDNLIIKIRRNDSLDSREIDQYQTAVLEFIATLNHQKNWTQQFHIGALRNNNGSLLKQIGADAGCDSMNDLQQAEYLSVFFNKLHQKDKLAKTILYNLNPKDSPVFATMIGNFNENSEAGKMQYGAAWWFLDQKQGIIDQLNVVSNYGLLRRFVGMLTDSRSFLSFSRHEYFRRILCDLIGRDVMAGELPNDMELLSAMVEEICYSNAKELLKI